MICLTITCSCTLLIRKVEHVLSCTLHSLHSTFDPNWDKATKFFLTSAKGEFEGPKSDSPNFTWFDFYKVKSPFFSFRRKIIFFFSSQKETLVLVVHSFSIYKSKFDYVFQIEMILSFFSGWMIVTSNIYSAVISIAQGFKFFFRLRGKSGLEHSQLNSYDHKDSSWSIKPTWFPTKSLDSKQVTQDIINCRRSFYCHII